MIRSYLLFALCMGLVSCSPKQHKFTLSQLPETPFYGTTPVRAESATAKKKCEARKITILGTNDIHGNFDAKHFSLISNSQEKMTIGGLALLSGVVKAARSKTDDCNGVLLLDGGDQFQGTLISNYNEGLLMAKVMKEIGYDAMVPGNHDYDFGPIGWENDSINHAKEEIRLNALERFSLRASRNLLPITTQTNSLDPKAALIQFKDTSGIPLLSANTYELDSLKDKEGNPVTASRVGCTPLPGQSAIDWTSAKRPNFLGTHIVKEVAGLKVAIIGLDIAITPTVTTKANVLDLCFRDPAEEFLAFSKALKKTVDLVVVVAHFGDATLEAANLIRDASKNGIDNGANDYGVSGFLDRVLTNPACEDAACIDAIVGGHTHQINQELISGVPAIQSGSNAQRFGRIELTYDPNQKRVDRAKTKVFGGKYLVAEGCDKGTESFCRVDAAQQVTFDGEPIRADKKIQDMIDEERKKVSILADRVMGTAEGEITPSRTDESALGDHLADQLLQVGKMKGATISFLNSGGIRAPLKSGPVTYSALYDVLPFNNRAVVIPDFKISNLLTIIQKSIKSCGKYGGMNFSGIKIQYRKDCSGDNGKNQLDPKALLVKVETAEGEVYYDDGLPEGQKSPVSDKVIQIVTLDFLADGGDYFEGFTPEMTRDVISRPYRERFVDLWTSKPFDWDAIRDGRMKNLNSN